MFHDLLKLWFHWLEMWGYMGVFFLMALESSIIPIPSEIIMPPAAFWAAQGKMDFASVIMAGTLGSFAGSISNYYIFQWLGEPVLLRYGKYLFMPAQKVFMAREWVSRFGAFGVFLARLLPVIRHLISIPAGILKMPVGKFSWATCLGAGLWCAILAVFGQRVLGSHPELLDSPEGLIRAMKDSLHWFLFSVILLAILYGVVLIFQRKTIPQALLKK